MDAIQQFFVRGEDVVIRVRDWIRRQTCKAARPIVYCYWVFIAACFFLPKFITSNISEIDDGLILLVHGPTFVFTIATRLLLGAPGENELVTLCDWSWVWVIKNTLLLALLQPETPGRFNTITSFLSQLGALNLICTLAKLKLRKIVMDNNRNRAKRSIEKLLVLLIPAAVCAVFFLASLCDHLTFGYIHERSLAVSETRPMRDMHIIVFPFLLMAPFYSMLLARLIFAVAECGACYYRVLQDRPPLGCFYYLQLSARVTVSLGNAFVFGVAIAFANHWPILLIFDVVAYIAISSCTALNLYMGHFKSIKIAQRMETAVRLPSVDEIQAYDDVCPICAEKLVSLNSISLKACGHIYHKNCLLSVVFTGDCLCPMCRQPIFADSA